MPGRPPKLVVTMGERVGRGVVITPEIPRCVGDYSVRKARLRCDCGTVYVTSVASLKPKPNTGEINTKSCGCLARAASAANGRATRKHGLCGKPEYNSWKTMMARCYNTNHAKYHRYGGRGIAVCADWHDAATCVAAIEALLGPRPDGFTLDRINNNGDYAPGNVRWASAKTQNANREYNLSLAFLTWAKIQHPDIVSEFFERK
jgi:hypothetical protein